VCEKKTSTEVFFFCGIRKTIPVCILIIAQVFFIFNHFIATPLETKKDSHFRASPMAPRTGAQRVTVGNSIRTAGGSFPSDIVQHSPQAKLTVVLSLVTEPQKEITSC
jgi:hypothetical protein